MRFTLQASGGVIAALAILTAAGPGARADIIADSVADFSGVQGHNGWYYGFYNVTTDADQSYTTTDFSELSLAAWSGSTWEWPGAQPPFVSFNAWAQHPDGTNREEQHHAIRRWVSTAAGEITITGRLAKWDTRWGNGTSNGTIGVLMVDGVPLLNHTLAWDDAAGIDYAFTLDVTPGAVIDLCVDSNGVDYFDGTLFTMTVTQVPGPATLASAGFALAFAGRRRRS